MYNIHKLPKCLICKKRLSKPECQYCQKHAYIGKLNSAYIDGHTIKKYFCINCKKKLKGTLAFKHKRCKKCNIQWQKGKNHPTYGIRRYGKSNPNYKYGKPKCKKCNKELTGYTYQYCKKHNNIPRRGKNNCNFGKLSPHGKRKKYKKIWMRSSWEMAYAKYLDRNKIKWQYEPKTFDLGTCTYTPDFYLPEKDLYIEIKGFWHNDAKKKFKLFKKLYTEKMIMILEKKDLQKLEILI